MQIAPTPSTWPDTVFVRVMHTAATGPRTGTVERYTAAPDIDPGVGRHFMEHEAGLLARSSDTQPWRADRRRIEAIDGDHGWIVASAVYDAMRGFLALGIAPTGPSSDPFAPGRLVLQTAEQTWNLDAASAPREAWAVLAAARTMHG